MRDIPISPRIIEINHNRRVRRLRLFILFFVLFIAIVLILSFLSGNRRVIIDNIEITGTHIIDQEKIKSEVYKNISGKYFYLFYRNNGFIYPHDKIYNNLLLNFPRIESLSVYRDDLKTLHIDISERTGSYLYCGSNIPELEKEIGENCYFIDNDGFIFDKAPYFSGNIYFKYYMTLEDDTVDPLGKQMMSIDQFHKIARFIDGVTSLGLSPIYIVTDKDDTNSLYLNHGVNSTIPKIIFKNDENLEITQDNFSIAMKKKEFADEIRSKYNTLQYIDLRFNNKVLYKFQ